MNDGVSLGLAAVLMPVSVASAWRSTWLSAWFMYAKLVYAAVLALSIDPKIELRCSDLSRDVVHIAFAAPTLYAQI